MIDYLYELWLADHSSARPTRKEIVARVADRHGFPSPKACRQFLAREHTRLKKHPPDDYEWLLRLSFGSTPPQIHPAKALRGSSMAKHGISSNAFRKMLREQTQAVIDRAEWVKKYRAEEPKRGSD